MTMHFELLKSAHNFALKIGDAVLALISSVPDTTELACSAPRDRANAIRRAASRQSFAAAGTLALPPGPWGWLTILPELGAVWRIQAQMVADIAAVHGKSATLTREQIAYCLFRHTAAQAVREIVAQVGERFLVQKASVRALQAVARQVGIDVSQRSLSRVVSRWVPIIGAAGVGAYAYYDTSKVARTAIAFFGSDIELIEAERAPGTHDDANPADAHEASSARKRAPGKSPAPAHPRKLGGTKTGGS
jgi:hypothetical protein